MPLNTGQILNNRYRIVSLLGKGGFGAVYKAWDLNLNGPVAIKENFDTSPTAQSQFTREATILFNLRHPNLPRVTDHFCLSEQGQYLVMDFVEGDDLEDIRLREGGRLPEDRVIPWITQVLDALAYIHSLQPPVIHRDIKPANIKITGKANPNLPEGRAMLVDFGVAKTFDASQRTLTGARAVTPGYAPYEQYGQAGTDARTDIYALGATIYSLLTGQPPIESISRVSGAALISPRMINPLITPETERVILRAMEVHPVQRYQSALEFKSELSTSASSAPFHLQSTTSTQLPLQSEQTLRVPAESSPNRPVVKKTIPWMWIGLAAILVVGLMFVGLRVASNRSNKQQVSQTSVALLSSISRTPSFSPSPQLTQLPTEILITKVTINPTQPGILTETPSSNEIKTRTPTPESSTKIGSTKVSPKDGMVLVYIPAGDFLMGSLDSDSAAQSDEKPQHKVFLDAFWIDQTEVTNAMYSQCVKANACQTPSQIGSATHSSYFGDKSYLNYPVVNVSWDDANSYCKWVGRQLPSEAQWEKAARGTDGRTYPWGENIDCKIANYRGPNGYCVGDTSAVGSYPQGASIYGALDMAGNVWEWVADWYDPLYYQSFPPNGWAANPSGPATGSYRVLRGGSWTNAAQGVRTAYRRILNDLKFINYGFRCGQ